MCGAVDKKHTHTINGSCVIPVFVYCTVRLEHKKHTTKIRWLEATARAGTHDWTITMGARVAMNVSWQDSYYEAVQLKPTRRTDDDAHNSSVYL